MDNEIESLWLSLGIKPDDSSASDAVDKIIKAVQSKLKSSIYGGKNGVITLPATIEGKFKDGREIDKSITDAYAAIYEKAKQMADESVSLTLKDIKDFKAQIDKFGKQTAKYRNNDVIANANNNLRQTVATYQNYINELKGEVAKTKKAQVKQTQKVKAKQKAKTKKSSYNNLDISDEEIESDIQNERKRRLSGIKQVEPKGYKHYVGFEGGVATDKTLKASDRGGPYPSNYARQMRLSELAAVKWMKKSLKTYKSENIADDYAKALQNGDNKNNISGKQKADETANLISNELAKILGGLEANRPDVSIDQFNKYLEATLQSGKNGKGGYDAILLALNKTFNRYFNTNGTIGITDGGKTGVGEGHQQAQKAIVGMIKVFKEKLDTGFADKVVEVGDKLVNVSAEEIRQLKILAEIDPREANKELDRILNGTNVSSTKKDSNSILDQEVNRLAQESKNTTDAVNQTNKLTATQTTYDKIENASERVADTAQETEQKAITDANREEAKEITADAQTGFNTDNNAKELLSAQSDLKGIIGKEIKDTLTGILSALSELKSLDGLNPATKLQADSSMQPCCDALTKLVEIAQHIDVTTGNVLQGLISMGAKLPTNLPALVKGETVKDKPIEKEPIVDKTNYEKLHNEKLSREIERERNTAFVTGAVDKYRSERAEKLKKIEAANKLKEIQNSVKNSLEIPGAVDIGANAEKMSTMSREQLKKIRAKRVTTFGLVDVDQNPTATGDLSRAQRVKATYGWGKNQANPFKDLKLSEGIEIDTKAITEALQNALQNNMFNAQTGGWFKNLIGPPTLYLGQDSLEKSRAEADAVNTIMAKMRDAAIDILQKIQNTQLDLQGMKESGKAVFKEDGTLDTEASDKSAITLFANLEEQKLALKGVLADVDMVDEVVENTGGNLTKILQQLGFAAPELANCNKIIKNINAGLDKNGKALKFQTRTAEILNYSFQLMGRYVGQIIKSWMTMLNPLSLIKRAFQDFTSYDTKWQRTMNVIKYNLRAIIRPAMQWIAQQIVNMIGLANALVKGIGKALGKKWDLFDKSAANTEKMRENLEQAANITAGFDELHDVGTDDSGANDLMGDIYTPQWKSLNDIFEKIGETLGNISKIVTKLNFWQWLAIAGAALLGFKILKWLISIFGKGKNPLEGVANGLSFLEKAVGWALLIWAFTGFTKALTDFVECMKTADWEDIAKSLIMLGGAFALLFAGITGVQGMTKWLGVTANELFGMSALVGVFALFVKALVPFIECIKDLGDEKIEVIAASITTLAAAFLELIGGVAGVEGITKLVDLDWKKLMGLAAVVGALDLFVKAIVPFIEAVNDIDGNKWDTIIPMIVGLGGAFISLAVGVGTISKVFTAMDWKAIGQLYVVAGVFEIFVGVLVLFVNAIKGIQFETLAGGALLIAAAFLSLAGAIRLITPALKMLDWTSIFQFAAVMAVFAGVIWVLQAFVQSLQDLSSDQILSGLKLLAGALAAITVAISVLAVVFTGVVTTGIGAAAIALLALVLAAVMGIIYAFAELVRALGESGEGIKLILEGVAQVIETIANGIATVFGTIGGIIIGIVEAVANGIKTVLEPILTFIDDVIGKVLDLAGTIAHEIGETVRTVIKTVGDVVLGIIDKIVNAIPNLLKSIIDFCYNIGPAIENSVDAICRSVTKLVNFVVSAVEYMANLVIGAINKISIQIPDWVPGIGGQKWGFNLEKIDIPRFVPKYETGTNYVPNDGLAYLHQGEAVVPKKYNQPYQQPGLSSEEREYMNQMMKTMSTLNATISQGIPVKGEFKQRGNDLVAVVEKVKNRNGNQPLNNAAFAR